MVVIHNRYASETEVKKNQKLLLKRENIKVNHLTLKRTYITLHVFIDKLA